eukprot:gene37994-40687_t
MYVVQQLQESNPWRFLNAARDAFYRRDFESALRHVAQGRGALPEGEPVSAQELTQAYDELAQE